MPTIPQLAIHLNNEVVESLKRTAQAMPQDKRTWKPLDEGRDTLNQIAECGYINRFGAKMLNEKAFPPMDREDYGRTLAETDTLEKALALLESGTAELNAAIEAFPADALDETLELPFGPGMVKSYAEIMLFSYWNMCYHLGQINYIQTLYGDKEMH